ncbi:MAG TPA: alpha/beta hydrolase [Candidatus Limnocylindrales bacterium]|jgi:pimeloyl-ACP methyl ester carboxylesterase|nr:alpha/beta hydrolase [Candidatus Limnocylindrales bacterium]
MKTFTSFDGVKIAYVDQGSGPAVVLLHGFAVDGLGQFGNFERIEPLLAKRQKMFQEVFGAAPPLPDPPLAGRGGLVDALATCARVVVPDMRGFGNSDKPRNQSAYENAAMARDVMALIRHLHLDSADIVGFSMGTGTAAGLLMLAPSEVKSAILAGVGDYVMQDTVLEFPKNWPVPDWVPRPLTHRIWAEEGARILEQGEVIPGHLASASLLAARATNADPKVLAAVIRGAVAPHWSEEGLRQIRVPVLVVNGRSDAANQKVEKLLKAIPSARFAQCEGDHHSTPYQPTFHAAVLTFLKEQWHKRSGQRPTEER